MDPTRIHPPRNPDGLPAQRLDDSSPTPSKVQWQGREVEQKLSQPLDIPRPLNSFATEEHTTPTPPLSQADSDSDSDTTTLDDPLNTSGASAYSEAFSDLNTSLEGSPQKSRSSSPAAKPKGKRTVQWDTQTAVKKYDKDPELSPYESFHTDTQLDSLKDTPKGPSARWYFKDKINKEGPRSGFEFSVRFLGPDKNLTLHFYLRDPHYAFHITPEMPVEQKQDINEAIDSLARKHLVPTIHRHLSHEQIVKYHDALQNACFTLLHSVPPESPDKTANTAKALTIFLSPKRVGDIPPMVPFVIAPGKIIPVYDKPIEESQLYKGTWFKMTGPEQVQLMGVKPLPLKERLFNVFKRLTN